MRLLQPVSLCILLIILYLLNLLKLVTILFVFYFMGYFCTCDMIATTLYYYNRYMHSFLYRNVFNYFCFTGESIGSLLGGYLFDTYGGVWSFRFFSYMSVLMCFLSIVNNYFGLTRESAITSKDNAGSTNVDLKITNNITDKKI